MTLSLENTTLTQQIEIENTTFADVFPDPVSDVQRCSLACIIIIIVIFALGFIVCCSLVIRKCIEKTYLLRSRIQSFIVSVPPVSGVTDSSEDVNKPTFYLDTQSSESGHGDSEGKRHSFSTDSHGGGSSIREAESRDGSSAEEHVS
ncbi:uncharacterized protein LOC134232026 [Saccostrea cucullata]|uniref:uncharacterized protein LOC134232026 n=1 Tax=Saccostrea cuccullata TaxID=36930 RepID=UPI002ED1DD90